MYFAYLRYVVRHKWFVMTECFKHGLIWRGLTHDLSKFLPFEFIWYARYFNGKYQSVDDVHGDARNYMGLSKEEVKHQFNLAWVMHQNRNKHHWQYWILINDSEEPKVLPMDYQYWMEMICDWVGAGKAQGFVSPKSDPYFETRNWYLKNKENIILNDKTRRLVEIYIGIQDTRING